MSNKKGASKGTANAPRVADWHSQRQYCYFVLSALVLVAAVVFAWMGNVASTATVSVTSSTPASNPSPPKASKVVTKPSSTASESAAPSQPTFDSALFPTEVHFWASECKLQNLPPASAWPLWPSATSEPFQLFAELKRIQRSNQPTSYAGTVEWLSAQLHRTRQDGGFPLMLQRFLWQLVAHSDKQKHNDKRNCFAKLVVDSGLINDVNSVIDDTTVPEGSTLSYVSVYGKMADPVLAQMLIRSAGVSPLRPRVDGDTVIQHALNWQEHSFFTLHGASCASHVFRFGESAAKMVATLSKQELLEAHNGKGESLVLAGVLSRSKLFVRELKKVLAAHLKYAEGIEFVRRLVNMPGQVGRTPLIAAANPHSIVILASKVLTRHGNVGFIDPTGKSGCQIDQLKELGLIIPANVTTGGITITPFQQGDLANAPSNSKIEIPQFDDDDVGPAPSIYRHSGLREAVHQWSVEFVDILIELGADVNQHDDGESTPLHSAAYAGNVPVIRRLLQAGAVPRSDKAGRTPADVAAARGFERAAVELINAGDPRKREELCFPHRCPQLSKLQRQPADSPTQSNSISADKLGWNIGPALSDPGRCDLIDAGNMTLDEFRDTFWKLEQPVIIRGAVAAHALKEFSRERILKQFGSSTLQAAKTITGQRSTSYKLTLTEYLNAARQDERLLDADSIRPPQPATVVEVRDDNSLLHKMSEFVRHHVPLAVYPEQIFQSVTPWSLGNYQLNIGTPRSCTAVHFHEVAVNIVLGGRKRWLLFPPAHSFYSTAHALDWLRQATPQLRATQRAMECVQNAGDAIFVPGGWAHGVLYEGETIGIGVLYNGGLINAN